MQKANKNDVRKEIADLITRIKEQSDRIGKEREIPQRELDLILYRIEELHKKTVVWAYLNELPAEVPVSQFAVTESNVPSSQFPVPGSEKVEQIIPKVEEKPIELPKPEIVIPVVTKHESTNKEQSTTGYGEQGTGNLKDVRTFIGINEKIMYIRQVFKGDDIAYNTAIEKFNNMNSWNEAQSYLSVLAGEYKWGKHDEPSEIFTQTIKRRFS